MVALTRVATVILATICMCEAAKILVVFSLPGKSHGILGDGFVRILLEAGHEVTYITPFPKKDNPPNLTQIDVSDNFELLREDLINVTAIMEKKGTPDDFLMLIEMTVNLTKKTFNNANVKKITDDPSQEFDLVIVEWLFSDITCGLSVVFNCPYIWFSTVEPHWMVLELIDEALHPAYNPDIMSSLITPFSFKERVSQLLKYVFGSLFVDYYKVPVESKAYEEIFASIMAKKGRPLPSLNEVRYNASLMFGNSHVSLGQATRLPQNYKPIAGYHIDPDVKPLPEDLKKIMDNAKYGVIYFSMGSNLKSKDIPNQIKADLLKFFGSLKYTVIWKFEESLLDLPENVHILKWAPQPSIISHKNCVLFITHGGLLSTTEAVHFGKPIIGIPVFGDQFINVDRAVNKGFAKKVELSYTMVDDLKIAVEEILSNSSYADKAKELSFIYHDRPTSPSAELAHWVQHVVHTRGAKHLRSPALQMPFYQKMYLDFAVLILAALLSVVVITKRVFCSAKKTNRRKKND